MQHVWRALAATASPSLSVTGAADGVINADDVTHGNGTDSLASRGDATLRVALGADADQSVDTHGVDLQSEAGLVVGS